MLDTLSRETLAVTVDGGRRGGASAVPTAQHRVVVHRGRGPQPALRRQPLAASLDGERRPGDAHGPDVQPASWPALALRPAAHDQHPAGREHGHVSPALRITRRGRLVLLALVATLLFVAFSIGRVMSSADPAAPAAPATHTVVVAPGDTAWSIAHAAMPRLDGRDAVDRLLALNHSDGRLQVGQTLVVPGS